jgi:hypothetical protein
VGVVNAYSGQSFQHIAEKYDMKILHFDFYNCESLKQEPIYSVLREKMAIIHEMLKNEDYDGDKCADILFENQDLVNAI